MTKLPCRHCNKYRELRLMVDKFCSDRCKNNYIIKSLSEVTNKKKETLELSQRRSKQIQKKLDRKLRRNKPKIVTNHNQVSGNKRSLRKQVLKLRAQLEALKLNRPVQTKHHFYGSDSWRELRYKVLKEHGRVCVLCRTRSGEMHVDHIKPRSLYPELELSINNLQVLCRDCNLGKSNKDQTDYRAESFPIKPFPPKGDIIL